MKFGLVVRTVQVTSVSPRLLVATSGKRASSVKADRSCGVVKEPPAARDDCSIVNLTEVPTCCSQTTMALPRPSTATRGLLPPGALSGSGALNSPPDDRTLAMTCDLPEVILVQAATTVPSGPAAASNPPGPSAGPGSGAVDSH